MDKQQVEQAVETGIKAFFRRIFGGGETGTETPAKTPQGRVSLPAKEAENIRTLLAALKAKAQDTSLAEAQRAAASKAAGDLEGLLGLVDVQAETQPPAGGDGADLRGVVAAQARAIEDLKKTLDEALAERKSTATVDGGKPPFKSRWGGAFRLG